MTARRRFAIALLEAVARHAPEENREWASAMLRELDFIEGDWAALFWALGSTTAVCRHSGRSIWVWFGRQFGFKEDGMSDFQKRAVGGIAGVGIAIAVTIFFMIVVHLSDYFFDFGYWMPKIVIAASALMEVLFVAAVIALWRKRRPMAVGILFTAILLGTHFGVYMSTHHLMTAQHLGR